MMCQFCKNSRVLKYFDTVEVRLPLEKLPRDVEIVEKVLSHVYCLRKREVVCNCCNDMYCEYERSVLDDFEDDFEDDV